MEKRSVIKIYSCGLTVYNSPHLGHVRGFICCDVLRRLLLNIGYKVIFVRNITDVDDKIFARCGSMDNLIPYTNKYIDEMNSILQHLNVLESDYTPRVTQYITKIQQYINILLKNKKAYIIDGDGIYMDTQTVNYGYFEVKKDTIDRVTHNPLKKHKEDFALWKFNDNMGFDYNLGKGHPGWHIECSAMSTDILGEEFDIHCGGKDLVFPHHENEIAQNIGYCGKIPAKIWFHNEMININSEKMSKSLDNFVVASDLIHNSLDGDRIRFFILNYHYRNIIDFSMDKYQQTIKAFQEIREFYLNNQNVWHTQTDLYDDTVVNYLCNDLDTPAAIQALHTAVCTNNYKTFFTLNSIFGFKHENFCTLSKDDIEQKLHNRQIAKKNGDFTTADSIRDYLASNFVKIIDTPNKSNWKYI